MNKGINDEDGDRTASADANLESAIGNAPLGSETSTGGTARGGRMIEVAALFVQAEGCYSQLPFVDCWTEERDARKYNGPFPVIAHPPCQLWEIWLPLTMQDMVGSTISQETMVGVLQRR